MVINFIALGIILSIVPSSACNQSYHVTTGIENNKRYFLIENGRPTKVNAITFYPVSENGQKESKCIWGVWNDESDQVTGKIFYGEPLEKDHPDTENNFCLDRGSPNQQNIIPLEKGREYELEIDTSSVNTYTKFRFKH